MALLLLAAAAIPGRIEAATVDHQLRPESADEAEQVAQLCAGLGVPHSTLNVEVGKGNLQDRARSARYCALDAWCRQRDLDALATAHQVDDQVETLVMRLNRGSGLSGLAGIRAATTVPLGSAMLIRPLLGWRRAELADLVRKTGVEAVADPSNEDEHFDRVRVRKGLADAHWLDAESWSRSAELLAEADAAIKWMLDREWHAAVEPLPEGFRYFPVRNGIEAKAFRHCGIVEMIFAGLGRAIAKSEAAALAERLISGERSNVAGIAARTLEMDGELAWDFGPENPRRTG